MIVLGIGRLDNYKRKYAECRGQFNAWFSEVSAAQWRSFHDIKEKYRSASNIGNYIVIFNIKGRKYRLETKVYYDKKQVIIKRFGPHSEYDKW